MNELNGLNELNDNDLDLFMLHCGAQDAIRIEVRRQNGESTVHEFYKPFVIVGSEPGSDCGSELVGLARRQLYFQVIEGRVYAIQLSEELSTYVGHTPWSAGWVLPSDLFEIGDYQLRVVSPHPSHMLPSGRGPMSRTPEMTYFSLGVRYAGKTHILESAWKIFLVGRQAIAKIRSEDPDLESIHAAVVWTPSGPWFVDLSARGGIHVEHRRIRYAKFEVGVNVQIAGISVELLPLPNSTAMRPTAASLIGMTNSDGLETSTALRNTPPPTGSHDTTTANTSALLQQVSQMQEQTFDQFREMLGSVMTAMGSVIQNQQSFMKGEMDRLERILMATRPGAEQSSVPGSAPSQSVPSTSSTAPTAAVPPLVPGPSVVQPPPTQPDANAPPNAQLHDWLENQLGRLEQQQKTVWQRLVDQFNK
jgi:hypothetical protein